MTDRQWHKYEDREEMAERTAAAVARAIRNAITVNGSALVMLPGGGTPQPIFAVLAGEAVDWTKVTIVPGDERLVPAEDPLSNFGMIRDAFSSTGALVLPLAGDDLTRAGAAAASDSHLAALKWPPDIVWLGMGGDGHTASIFPGLDLEKAMSASGRVVTTIPNPLPENAPVARLTLTRSAIQSARKLIVTITGHDKRALLERTLEEGENSAFPIGRVLAGQNVDIYWAA